MCCLAECRQCYESEKDLTGEAMPNSHEERGKGSYVRAERGREEAVSLAQWYRDRVQGENKLGGDRTSQRMRMSQKVRTDCQS